MTYLLGDTIQPITGKKERVCFVRDGRIPVFSLRYWPFSLALGFASELCDEKACRQTWEGKFT